MIGEKPIINTHTLIRKNILNHFNMFGGGYGSQADSMMGRLLAEIS